MRAASGTIAVLAFSACASAQPPARSGSARARVPEQASAPVAASSGRKLKLKPRPPLALASILPARDPPWPLTELPSLQPHLDLAMAHDACTEDWAKRHANDSEASAYVASWCKIRGGDRDAVATLGQLARTARHAIARAALLDVVDLLADEELPADAVARLDAMGLTTPDTLDLLAGTYAGLGMHDDAAEVGERVLRASDYASPRVRCERFLAWGQLDEKTTSVLAGLESTAGECGKRAEVATCLLSPLGQKCYGMLSSDEDLLRRSTLFLNWNGWHDDPTSLVAIAREVEKVAELPGAEELAVTALEDAILSSSCEFSVLDAVTDTGSEWLRDPHHSPRFDDRLRALAALKPQTCPSFR